MKKILKVVIITIIFIILTGVSFYLGGVFNNQKVNGNCKCLEDKNDKCVPIPDTNTQSDLEPIKEELNGELVNDANNLFQIINGNFCGEQFIYGNYTKERIFYSDLKDEDIMRFVYKYIHFNENYEHENISLVAAREAIIKLFGKDAKNYTMPDLFYFNNCWSYLLNKDTNTYELQESGCGCGSTGSLLTNIKRDDNKIFIDLLYYEGPGEGEEGYYSSKIEKVVCTAKEDILENKDKFPNYRFTFIKNNNDYQFVSIEEL